MIEIVAPKYIVFEREAYDNDGNLNYLNERKPYSWFKYFFNSNINYK